MGLLVHEYGALEEKSLTFVRGAIVFLRKRQTWAGHRRAGALA